MWGTYLIGNRKKCITAHGINIILVLFYFTAGCFHVFKIQNINIGQPTSHKLYPHMTPQNHKISSLRVT